MVSKILVGMSATNIHLLFFKNSKSPVKTWNLNAGISEPIQKKTRLRFLTLHSPFCLFLIKILLLNYHPECTSCDKTIRCALTWVVLTQTTLNLEFVDLKCVTYTQVVPLPLTTHNKQK